MFVIVPPQRVDADFQIGLERCTDLEFGCRLVGLSLINELGRNSAADGPLCRIVAFHAEMHRSRGDRSQTVIDRPFALITDIFAAGFPAVDEGYPFRSKPAVSVAGDLGPRRGNHQGMFHIGSDIDLPGRFGAFDHRIAQQERHGVDPVADHVEIRYGIRAQTETVFHGKRHPASVGRGRLAGEFDVTGPGIGWQIAGHLGPGIGIAGQQFAPTVFQRIEMRGTASGEGGQIGRHGIVGLDGVGPRAGIRERRNRRGAAQRKRSRRERITFKSGSVDHDVILGDQPFQADWQVRPGE